MQWTRELTGRLNVALNEATVFGVRYDGDAAVCRLLVEVASLPEVGPTDPDPRRVLVLSGASSVDVLLRQELPGEDPAYGPALPLADLEELGIFLASLPMVDAMYGWEFVDRENSTEGWPAEPSLRVVGGPTSGAHSLTWFAECADGEGANYVLEGVVVFDAVSVERADAIKLDLDEFLDDGHRWWQAFRDHDARLTSQAPAAALSGAPSWRDGSERTAKT